MKAHATKGKERFRVVEFVNPSGALAYRVTGWTLDRQSIRENFPTHGEALHTYGSERPAGSGWVGFFSLHVFLRWRQMFIPGEIKRAAQDQG